MRIAFFGHRQIFDKTLPNRLYSVIEQAILAGCINFSVGCHGEFDKLTLHVLLLLKKKYDNIVIEIVLTSLSQLKKLIGEKREDARNDIHTIIYEIEETHYKRKIIHSNHKMLDNCDAVICYVDTTKYKSGAKLSLNYAIKKSLVIINLFDSSNK